MARKLFKQDIIDILTGATFLGAGGGGALSFGLDMLSKLEQEDVKIELDLLTIDELQESDYAAMVAGLGSPKAMLDTSTPLFGPDAVYAFEAYQTALKAEGKTVSYLYSGEMGGFNTFVPMMVAMRAGIKFVDTDGNGRAVPELNTCLVSVRGFRPNPMGLGTYEKDRIVCDAETDKKAEYIARQLCMAFKMKIGFSTWGLSKNELAENSVAGCITLAQNVGKALNSYKKGDDLGALLKDAMPNLATVCEGVIEAIDGKTEGGFDYASTRVKAKDGRVFTFDSFNENLVLKDENGKVLLTVPELICVFDTDARMPLTNADTKVGQNIYIAAAPAHPLWWKEDKKAYECWPSAFTHVNYTGDFVKFDPTNFR